MQVCSHNKLIELYCFKSRKTAVKIGLDYCFDDKNKDIQRIIAANIESLADIVKGNIDQKDLENFYVAIQI